MLVILLCIVFFSSRRRHTRYWRDWSSDVCSSDLPGAHATNAALARLAAVHGLDVVAAGNVHHATPQRHRVASAMAAVRARRSLAELDGWLDLSGAGHLRSGAETAAALASYPEAVVRRDRKSVV